MDMNSKSAGGRAFTSGHQARTNKTTHAPQSTGNRRDALCGLTNTAQVIRNEEHVEIFGRSLHIDKSDRPERMVDCKRCRKALGL